MFLFLSVSSVWATHYTGGDITYRHTPTAGFPNRYTIELTIAFDCTTFIDYAQHEYPVLRVQSVAAPYSIDYTPASPALDITGSPSCLMMTCAANGLTSQPWAQSSFHVMRATYVIDLPSPQTDWRFMHIGSIRDGSDFATRWNLDNGGLGNQFFYIESTLNNSPAPQGIGNHDSPRFSTIPMIEAANLNPLSYNSGITNTVGNFTCGLITPLSSSGTSNYATNAVTYNNPLGNSNTLTATNPFYSSSPITLSTLGILTAQPNSDNSYIPLSNLGGGPVTQAASIDLLITQTAPNSSIVIGTIRREVELRIYAVPQLSGFNGTFYNPANSTVEICPNQSYNFNLSDFNFRGELENPNQPNNSWGWTVTTSPNSPNSLPAGTSISISSNSTGTETVSLPQGITTPGTYIIRVRANNRFCPFVGSNFADYTIIVRNLVPQGIIVNNPCSNPVTLSVGTPLPGITYTWSNNQTGSSTSYSPPSPGVYTFSVTASDGSNCSSSATRTLTLGAIATITTPPVTICTGNSTVITATGGGNYSWSNGATTSSINVTPNITTTYTVTVTGTNGCTATAARVVTVNPDCCPPIANFTYLQGSTTTIVNMSSFLAPGTYTGLSIQIDKRININGNYTFNNCTFRMNPGAEIVVKSPSTLTLNDGTYSGQCKLWRGITIETNGTVILNTNVTLRDALYAIEMKPNTTLNVNSARFTNNVIGVYKAYSPSNNLELLNYNVKSAIFEKTGTLLQSYVGCPNTPIQNENGAIVNIPTGLSSPEAYAGVLISNSGVLSLGNSNVSFSGLPNGIVAIENLEVRVANTLFTSISLPTNTTTLYGNAIYMDGYAGSVSSLNVSGCTFNTVNRGVVTRRAKAEVTGRPYNAGIWNNTFTNCTLSISAVNVQNTTLNIASNTINNPSTGSMQLMGINIQACQGAVSSVANNTINSTGTGVRLWGNTPFKCDIVSNTITVSNASTGALPTAISIQDASNSLNSSNVINVKNNQIIVGTNGYRGIYAQSIPNVNLISNYITLSDQRLTLATPPTGISLEGVSGTRVNCNTVNFTPATPNLNAAQAYRVASASASTDIKLSSNSSNGTRTGFWIQGGTTQFSLQGNDIQKHTWGLWLQDQANIGAQDYKANTWSSNIADYSSFSVGGSFPPAQVRHSGQLLAVQFCRFKTSTSVAVGSGKTYTPTLYTMDANVATNQWFNPAGTTTANSIWPSTDPDWVGCNSLKMAGYNAEPLTAMELTILDGEIDQTIYEEEQNWSADRQLYEKLASTTATGTEEQQFVADNANDSKGLLAAISTASQEAYTVPENIKLTILSNSELMESLLDSIWVLDSLLSMPNADAVGITAQIQTLKIQLDNLYAINKTLLESLQNNLYYQLDALGDSNANIPVSADYEQNEKQVNAIYLSTVAKGILNFDTEQEAQLLSIASQCPLAGGEAVYAARSLYSSIDPSMTYNDEAMCGASGYGWQEKMAEPFSDLFVLSPNPSEGLFSINMPSSDMARHINVYDNLGRLIKSMDIAAHTKSVDIDLSNYAQGLFFINIIENEQSIYSSKVSIVK